MSELESYRKPFETALRLLLVRWLQWSYDEPIHAFDLSFDCANTEICISLLTDREPHLIKRGLTGLEEPWPVAEWRLTGISRSGKHCFPDAAELVHWMHAQGNRAVPPGSDPVKFDSQLNEELKRFFFEVATGPVILHELRRFRRAATRLHVRVHWFFEQQPPLRYALE